MADLERWRIVELFTIYQVALLIEGYDPADFEDAAFSDWDWRVRSAISPVLTALRHAIESEMLPLSKSAYDEGTYGEIDFHSSLVHVDQLRKWLAKKAIVSGFFTAPDLRTTNTIENPFGRYYAPKLAAANAAWKAVTSDPGMLRGKSPKAALMGWLTEHAAEYDLQNKNGTSNATGIEEVAKVANWQPTGGAPPTPKAEDKPKAGFDKTSGGVHQNLKAGSFGSDPDDEIPF